MPRRGGESDRGRDRDERRMAVTARMSYEDSGMSSAEAGPSRLPSPPASDIDLSVHDELDEVEMLAQEEREREEYLRRAKEYAQLEESVKSSDELLASLASYLSTFQTDLSSVSGQIADLQGKSRDIENQLKGRKTLLPPLNSLLQDLVLAPSLILTLRDTTPQQKPDMWLEAVPALEDRLMTLKSRGKVKAAQDLGNILEGLRSKAIAQIPPFLLSLLKPLKSASTGLSTNLPVLQSSLLLKYQPFYGFLQRQAPSVAKQVERGYVNAARAYYETGMRRYARSLGVVKARTVEKADLIGSVTAADAAAATNGSVNEGIQEAFERLQYSKIDMEGEAGNVTLAYMTDDPAFRQPIEALFRSLALVLLDNASAEFTFLVRFFSQAPASAPNGAPVPRRKPSQQHMWRPTSPGQDGHSPSPSLSQAMLGDGMSEAGGRRRMERNGSTVSERGVPDETLHTAERIWHEVLDPALDYCQAFFTSTLAPAPPPAMSILTIIRLNDRVLASIDHRGCVPLETFCMGWKLALWPVFQKEMGKHVDSLKKLADEAEGKGFAGFVGRSIKDAMVRQVAIRYAALFTCISELSEEAQEAMMFSSMTRLRIELTRLITVQSKKIKAASQQQSFVSTMCETVLHQLTSGPGPTTHPRMQSELSYWRTREEDARRRIAA